MGLEIKKAKKEDVASKNLIKDLDKTLETYRQGKSVLEATLIENEEWYKSLHWDYIRNAKLKGEPEPVTAYLFNTLFNKHADFMDNYAYPNYLPQERDDEQEAQALSKIVPTILDRGFKKVYSRNSWEKIKHGTAVYGVMWDSDKDHGVGDVSITDVDLMNCYWLPGVSDIQESPRFYVAKPVSNDILNLQYPEIDFKSSGTLVDKSNYHSTETADKTNMSLLVDCYMKERVDTEEENKIVIRFIKYCGSNVIYDSFNDEEHPEYKTTSYYADGAYPFVFDVLFNVKNSPCGFGLFSILKSPQLYIDKLDQIILRNAAQAGRIKHLIRRDLGVNLNDLMDTSVDVVEFEGSLSEENYKQYQSKSLAAFIFNHRARKIEELKDVGTTMDFNRGDGGAGVTAASAIALLQEAGNKTSRDMLDMSYEALTEVFALVVERMRQFYTVTKTIRLETNNPQQPYNYIDYSNKGLVDQETEQEGQLFTRRPYFDIKVVPEKKSPYSQIAHNEMAKELNMMGFFNPESAQGSLVALEMMKFEGKEKVKEQIQANNQFQQQFMQMQQMIQQMQMENVKMKAIIQEKAGVDMGIDLEQFKQGGNTQ